jgi:hypothetical protein
MNIKDIVNKIIKEASSESGSRGSYIAPLQPGFRNFKKNLLAPFTDEVGHYDSPLLRYDSYDGKMDKTPKQIRKIEKKSEKVTNYIKKHPLSTFSDEDGNSINQTPGRGKKIVPIKESDSTITSGEYSGPIEIGLRKWKTHHLAPFTYELDHEVNRLSKQKTLKNNIKRVVGMWDKNKNNSYEYEVYDAHTINEDLAVWFGKKKKPKGSSQPKGPWVNICSKVDGKHPPCGRQDTSKGSYPKCRAAGVAGKMSDSQKRSACQQKRTAEKKDTQTGKGQKPIMTSYKTKKESVDSLIDKILIEIRNSF